MSHHCFWLNKCIGAKNKVIYTIFVFCSFFYSIFSLFICLILIFDTVNTPYVDFKFLEWFYLVVDRGYRVLGANVVAIFSFFSTFPLFFLLMIEMFKLCGLLGKKQFISGMIKVEITTEKNDLNSINDENKEKIELQAKEPLLNEEENDNINNKGEELEINTNVKIPKENFPIVDEGE